jgi:hypothetical protein
LSSRLDVLERVLTADSSVSTILVQRTDNGRVAVCRHVPMSVVVECAKQNLLDRGVRSEDQVRSFGICEQDHVAAGDAQNDHVKA